MHELSIAQSILGIAKNAAPKNAMVSSVALQIGELSGIEIESLKFALSILKENTILERANLDIEVIPGEAECTVCGKVFHIPHFASCCPACGSYSIKIIKGREMRVLNIVVED